YNGKGDFYTSYGLSGSTLNKNKPVPFYGMAPEAEIAAACGDNTTANIVLACQQLASYIKSTGKPGLISLSFGSYLGPHDNSDPATTALNTIAKDIPFFIAAGNDGGETFSLVGTFGNGNNSAKTFIRPEGSSAQGEVAIWSGDSRPLTVRMIIFDRTTEQELFSYTIPTGESKVLATGNYSTPSYIRDEAIDLAFTRSTIQVSQKLSNANNRYQTSIIYNLSLAATNSSQRYALGIAVEGANGQHYDLVQKTGSPGNSSINRADLSGWGINGWLDGTDEMSISDLSCGTNMLCIGSWNTRVSWTNLGNNSYTYGGDYRINQVSPFTAYGTLADGRTLPLVCAPGAGKISTISSHYYSAMGLTQRDVAATAVYNGKTNYYELQQGTSMATPVAAGIGALWLQANPDLTPADIKYIITHTSDAQTDANRQIAWGHGRINALEGIKMAVKIGAGVSDVTVNPADIIIAANGNNWQVVAPGAASVNTVVYDLNGRPVISSNVKGGTAEISGESLQPGIYVINVNNVLSRRIAVK
ncbi:MAG: S8 family serine peptidase, partial [Muribaculaceae bacterium]|nr:S8 family serine peptidase [Muribaculaceae bacterium]